MDGKHSSDEGHPRDYTPDNKHGLELVGGDVADKRDIGVYLPWILWSADDQPSHQKDGKCNEPSAPCEQGE